MKRLIMAMLAILTIASCTVTKRQQATKEIQKAITVADIVIKRIDSVINLPIVPKVVQITPTDMDNTALEKMHQYLLIVMPYFSDLKTCYNEDLNTMLLCIATNLRNVPQDKRELLIQQLKIIIAISQPEQK